MGAVHGAEAALVDVGVNFSGGEVGMAEEFLDDPQVSAAGEQVSGERVAEEVGVNRGGDAGAAGGVPDHAPEAGGGERAAVAGEEDFAGAPLSQQFRAAGGEVNAQCGLGAAADEDQAFLAAFANDAGGAFGEVEIFLAEGGEFTDAQAAGVEGLEDGAVAEAERGVRPADGEEAVNFFLGEGGGEAFGEAGEFEQRGEVAREEGFVVEVAEEIAEGGYFDFECGRGGVAEAGLVVEVGFEDGQGEVGPGECGVVVVEPGEEAFQDDAVHGLGVRGVAAFEGEAGQAGFEFGGAAHGATLVRGGG